MARNLERAALAANAGGDGAPKKSGDSPDQAVPGKVAGKTRATRAMFKIQLTDFRCFAGPQPVEVLPITFLVGENSAGKTTFLAAVRILLEGFVRSPQNPFNREPYHLGGFDQIAHYRGGVRGRADEFCLQMMIPASPEAVPPVPRTRRQSTATHHKFTFIKGSPQPELTQYEFGTPDASVRMDLADKFSLRLIQDGNEVFQFKPQRLPPSAVLRKDMSYLRFVFDELAYGINPESLAGRPELQNLIDRVFEQFRESMRFAMRKVFASAPVRTQPLRTYTPSEIVASAEGAHVPLEMARQKISSPEDWTTVHDKLAQFGKNSGLFDDIDIRLLGRKDGDPFQIIVKTGGPHRNIVDVGYGVSQALPIIYQLEHRQHDTFLLQQPEVHLHPRAQAALGTLLARLSKQRASSIYVIETHSDYIIDRVRMEVAAGRLDAKNVTIVFFDRQEHEVLPVNLYLSEKGDILHPPDNFRSFFLEEHQRLLGL